MSIIRETLRIIAQVALTFLISSVIPFASISIVRIDTLFEWLPVLSGFLLILFFVPLFASHLIRYRRETNQWSFCLKFSLYLAVLNLVVIALVWWLVQWAWGVSVSY